MSAKVDLTRHRAPDPDEGHKETTQPEDLVCDAMLEEKYVRHLMVSKVTVGLMTDNKKNYVKMMVMLV